MNAQSSCRTSAWTTGSSAFPRSARTAGRAVSPRLFGAGHSSPILLPRRSSSSLRAERSNPVTGLLRSARNDELLLLGSNIGLECPAPNSRGDTALPAVLADRGNAEDPVVHADVRQDD